MVLHRERDNVGGDTSIFVAYVLWWFGGAFQLHHWYLGRDNQGLLGLCIAPFLLVTIPVWWLSWVRDMFRIPEYVAAANRDPSYVVPKKEAIKNGSPPMFSVSRLFAQLFFAWYFHSVFANLKLQLLVGLEVPQIDVAMGLVGCAFGAWMVSCCGDEESPFVNILGATIGCYFMEYHIWGAVLGAQYFRAYRPDFADKRKVSKGIMSNAVKGALLISLIGFAAITTIEIEVNGENISIREAIKNAMRSEGFKEFMEMFSQFMTDWSEEGFEKAFPKFAEQLKERFDVDGEDHAYKVLGLKSDASMAEIKKAHRKLALQNHPDKGGSDDKFREIQEAFETLQKVHGAKSKRPKFREPTK